MNYPMITWCVIAGLCTFLQDIFAACCNFTLQREPNAADSRNVIRYISLSRHVAKIAKATPMIHEECVFFSDKNKKNLCRDARAAPSVSYCFRRAS